LDRGVEGDLAIAQGHNPLGVTPGEFDLVERDQQGKAALVSESNQQVQNFMREDRIERSHGLVGEDDLGLLHQSPSNGESLLLTSRELIATEPTLLFEADSFEAVFGPFDLDGPGADKINQRAGHSPASQGPTHRI
jgi:hypothetical protein